MGNSESHTARGNRNRSFMRLDVWNDALNLFALVERIVRDARLNDWKLRSQLLDAAQSVSANIAEGYGRRSLPEYIHFCYYARGSLAETLTRVIGLKVTEAISIDDFERIDTQHYATENKLERLIESLEKRRKEADWSTTLREAPADDFLH